MNDKLSIDVHILTMDSTPLHLRKQAIESVHAAARLSPIPVHLHVLEGVVGHIGQGRAKGYALGTSPYVTYVDDDDHILPEAFQKIAPHLESYPDAVCPSEYIFFRNQLIPRFRRHHLIVFKREHLIDHSRWTCASDAHQNIALRGKNVIDIDDLVYVWRRIGVSNAVHLQKHNMHEYEGIERFLKESSRAGR